MAEQQQKRPAEEQAGEQAPIVKKLKTLGNEHEFDCTEKELEALEKGVRLNEYKYAWVSEFRGTKMLSLREFYVKDGKLAFTKKGITLKRDQAIALRDGLSSLLAQLE